MANVEKHIVVAGAADITLVNCVRMFASGSRDKKWNLPQAGFDQRKTRNKSRFSRGITL